MARPSEVGWVFLSGLDSVFGPASKFHVRFLFVPLDSPSRFVYAVSYHDSCLLLSHPSPLSAIVHSLINPTPYSSPPGPVYPFTQLRGLD